MSTLPSNIQCLSAIAVVDGIINNQPINSLLSQLKGRSRKKEQELRAALAKPISAIHKFLLKTIRDHINYLNAECEQLDQQIFASLEPYKKQWEILQTIPGIDKIAAAIIIAEIGIDMQQWATSEKFCSWAGLAPGNNESAGKRKTARTVKGAPFLRKILCEVANATTKTTSQFKSYYKALQVRRGHKRSIIATGHKILRVIYNLLSGGTAYVDPEIDYQALMVKRNAPRWIQCLIKYGYLNPNL